VRLRLSRVLTDARLRRKDGTGCDCESIGKLVTNRDGEKYIVLYIRDITERKRMDMN
jgi:PAS domain S-box-containing protein